MEEEKTAINWLVSNIYHLNFFINTKYRKNAKTINNSIYSRR